MTRRARAFVPILWTMLSGAACSTTQGGGDPGGGAVPADSVFVQGTSRIVVAMFGGGESWPRPMGACSTLATYDYSVLDGGLTWNVCQMSAYNDPATYRVTSGARQLSAGERQQVEARARAVQLSTRDHCIFDVDLRTIQLTTAAGETLYGEEGNACTTSYAAYVTWDSLDGLVTTLLTMAPWPGSS